MICYDYQPETREFIGTEMAQEDPKHPGQYLIPANSTTVEPPANREGFAIVFDGSNWQYIQDYRGITIWKDHWTSKEVTELGPIPEGWSIEQPAEPMTRKIIERIVYDAKYAKAYCGITINEGGVDYLFATDIDSIAMCNATLISFQSDSDTVNWKVWQNNEPVTITLNAVQFKQIFVAGMQMIQQAFAIESTLNAEYNAMTDEQIAALTEAEVREHVRQAFDSSTSSSMEV